MCLYRSGYDFKRLFTRSEFYDRDRSAFYRAIQSVREHELDLTGWIEFFVGALATQMEEVKARGTVAIRADVVAGAHRLNARLSAILTQILTTGRLTLSEVESLMSGVNRRTLQRDMRKLLDKGLLREIGAGPTDPSRHYLPGVL